MNYLDILPDDIIENINRKVSELHIIEQKENKRKCKRRKKVNYKFARLSARYLDKISQLECKEFFNEFNERYKDFILNSNWGMENGKWKVRAVIEKNGILQTIIV